MDFILQSLDMKMPIDFDLIRGISNLLPYLNLEFLNAFVQMLFDNHVSNGIASLRLELFVIPLVSLKCCILIRQPQVMLRKELPGGITFSLEVLVELSLGLVNSR